MRIGIVSSSGGYVFSEICSGAEHLKPAFAVVTDRPCGIEEVCLARNIPCERIVCADRNAFSRSAAAALRSYEVDFVLLFFNRLISAELYDAIPCLNIHPSLLPAFPGMRALTESRERNVRFLGATLHLVTEKPDAGPIVAQVSTPIWPPVSQESFSNISFVQRVYLALLAVELAHIEALSISPATGRFEYLFALPYDAYCNPTMQDGRMLEFIRRLQSDRKIRVTA